MWVAGETVILYTLHGMNSTELYVWLTAITPGPRSSLHVYCLYLALRRTIGEVLKTLVEKCTRCRTRT